MIDAEWHKINMKHLQKVCMLGDKQQTSLAELENT